MRDCNLHNKRSDSQKRMNSFNSKAKLSCLRLRFVHKSYFGFYFHPSINSQERNLREMFCSGYVCVNLFYSLRFKSHNLLEMFPPDRIFDLLSICEQSELST